MLSKINDENEFLYNLVEILNSYIKLNDNVSKQVINNIFSLIDEGWLAGDLYVYLDKQLNKKSVLKEINNELEATSINSIRMLLDTFKSCWTSWPRIQVSDFELGKRYTTRMISCLGENNAYVKGMYLRKFDNYQIAILKAELDNPNAIYQDTWIEEKKVLKYYFECHKSDTQGERIKTYSVNKEIIENIENNKPLCILVFTKMAKEKDFVFEGKYKAEGYYGKKNNLWFKLVNDNESYNELIDANSDMRQELNSVIEKIEKKDIFKGKIIDLPKKYEQHLTSVVRETVRNSTLQKAFRNNLIFKAEGRCEVCGLSFEPILVASHIKPVADILRDDTLDDNEKIDQVTDAKNGLLLCEQHDALFDKGYITFNKSGKIRYSKSLSDILKKRLIGNDVSINKLSFNDEYMNYHRTKVFKK